MIPSRRALSLAALLSLQTLAHADVLKEHPGYWLGDMKIPDGPTLKIGAEIFTRADGSHWASLSSPDQGSYDIPAASITDSGDALDLDIGFARLKLTWVQDHFAGEFRQGKDAFKFDLKQVPAFPKTRRPQQPQAPFPYSEQQLAIPSADGVTLGATLSLPKGRTRPNLVVLVHGSGPGTRDLNGAGHEIFAVLADHLARNGVAVLRYDKRGISRSTGSYDQHTTAQLIDDVHAVARAMKSRRQFNRVGLVGLSEGPGLAAAVAARDPAAVDFLVSLGGIGLSGLEMMYLQDRIAALDNGATPAEADQLMVYVRKYYQLLLAHKEPEPRIAAMKAMQDALPDSDKALIKKYKMNAGTLSLSWAAKPFLSALLRSDPPQDWRRVRSPVLVLGGAKDHQVPAAENVAGIAAALKAGGNGKVEAAILPSLNHLLQTAQTGKEDEYDKIGETMAPLAMRRVAAFVKKQR
jgi:pimeloyl-ACP methyl ester carboxylesterase